MITDYLRHLLPTKSFSFELSDKEATLIRLIDRRANVFDDGFILTYLEKLKKNNTFVKVNDFGAGSRLKKSNVRSIKFIAKNAAIVPKFGQFYASIIKALDFNLAIELGTSLGVGTCYLAQNAKEVITIEGCFEIAKLAANTFNELQINNIKLKIGEFSAVLPYLKGQFKEPTFVYIDGNHTEQATLDYFQFFKSHLPAGSIMIFDDIYWSKGMKRAWNSIKSQPYFTIDLFKVGVLLLEEKSTTRAVYKKL